MLVVALRGHPLGFSETGFLTGLESTKQSRLGAREPRGSTCLCLPKAGNTSVHGNARLMDNCQKVVIMIMHTQPSYRKQVGDRRNSSDTRR